MFKNEISVVLPAFCSSAWLSLWLVIGLFFLSFISILLIGGNASGVTLVKRAQIERRLFFKICVLSFSVLDSSWRKFSWILSLTSPKSWLLLGGLFQCLAILISVWSFFQFWGLIGQVRSAGRFSSHVKDRKKSLWRGHHFCSSLN